ncbi:MAG: peptidase MA family metallohydrolase [Planctomycetota bacterium]|nr:peptidase MA family metallohydrolase [Planctomycetota bacterium]
MSAVRLASVRCRRLAGWSCALAFLTVSQRSFAVDLAEATTLLKHGKHAECIQATSAAIDEGQYSETWRELKIEAELATGQYPAALATLEASLERNKSSVRVRWIGYRVCLHNGLADRANELLDQIDELMDGGSWRYTDPASRIALGKFYLHRGVDAKQVLDALYGQVKKRSPDYAAAYTAAGQLALSKHDYALAAEEFATALKLDATDADIHYGIGAAFASSDSEKSEAAFQAALATNPNHLDTLLYLADHEIDAESYEEAEALLERVMAVNMLEPRAWAYRAVLAHLRNETDTEEHYRKLAFGWWDTNPEVDYIIGRKLSQKYRFAEGVAHLRTSLTFDRDYLPAQTQLAQDLLRLGEEEEGWKLATDVYGRDGYSVVAHNLVTLRDNVAKFRTLHADGFLVRMEAREADIYGPRVIDLLSRAKEQLCSKYDTTVADPVIVEIFPKQEDFAIRTFGLPGGAGFLGVCFGRVITANSPASQTATPTNWQATLWHEFCHVVTLQKTNNKMPRWLSEGISVYEERQANATWGQTMTPEYRAMILGDALTPVSKLSGAFLSPPSAMHLQFAYYESSLVVEYLVERYGLETLQRILVDLGAGMSINDALHRYSGSIDALDHEFAEYARNRARQLAPDADWEKPDLPEDISLDDLAAWLVEHPNSYIGLQQYANRLLGERRWQETQTVLEQLLKLYPKSIAAASMLARVQRELKDTAAETATLQQIADLSADHTVAYQRLVDLATERDDWEEVRKNGERLLAVNPLLPAPHRSLVTAAEHLKDDHLATTSLNALLQMDPIDPADMHYRLGCALRRTGDLPAAKRQILMSLEEAPRFRAAHRQLLEILDELKENEAEPSAVTTEEVTTTLTPETNE